MNTWEYTPFCDGYCSQLEAFAIKGGRLKMIKFPSFMALLEHPKHGTVLFDTGYSERFFSATKAFPYRFYRWLTPVKLKSESTAKNFLNNRGIHIPDRIVVSHFHADHMGALYDFPESSFICSKSGYTSIEAKKGIAALKQAYLPDLLPSDFKERARFTEEMQQVELNTEWHPFAVARDLFGDQSLLAIDLPGHAAGQIGLAFTDQKGALRFLVSDACWLEAAYRQNRPPAWLGWLLQHDRTDYLKTLKRLHQLSKRSPDIEIIPTHA